MANPLTLYVPIKQDKITQEAAQAAHDHFVSLHTEQLDRFQDVHYARLALIPNPGGVGTLALCVITTFDHPMIPYLRFFWNDKALRALFGGIADMALNPPVPPIADFDSFVNFINDNNLSNGSNDLYESYGWTVQQIKAKLG
jgi:hypothetical protein